jgi:hypothetical protein
MLPTLSEVKAHLRLEESQAEEDAHLQSLVDAAADYTAQYLGRSLPWADDNGDLVPVPASVKAAVLLIVCDLYENREAQVIGATLAVNPAVDRLLHFYRVGMGI